jgi:hypothetical protein
MNADRSLFAALGHASRMSDFENKAYASETFVISAFVLAFVVALEKAVTYRETRAPAEVTVSTKYVPTMSTRTRFDGDDQALVPDDVFATTLNL